MKRSILPTVAFVVLIVLSRLTQAQPLQPQVRVGFRNELPVPVLIRDLRQPFTPPIRLVPKETVWDRLPANAHLPVAVSEAISGQLLLKTTLTIPPAPSVLYVIQVVPPGNVVLTPQPAP